jgi:pimeloyl-ACP methyl ester carboxylesterase
MERCMPRVLTCLLVLCISAASVQSSSAPSNAKSQREEHQISFPTDDQGIVYADLYGQGDRGVVLVHGGSFTKESWRPQAQYLVKAGFFVLALDMRGFGQSHGPGDSDIYTAPMKFDVLAAVRYLRSRGAKTVALIGASMGGGAAADACIALQPGEIDRLVLLAAEPDSPADKIKAPLLVIVARDDANESGPRLPRIRRWFNQAPQPKELVVVNGSAHAQFLFRTDQSNRIMRKILRFLSSPQPSDKTTAPTLNMF